MVQRRNAHKYAASSKEPLPVSRSPECRGGGKGVKRWMGPDPCCPTGGGTAPGKNAQKYQDGVRAGGERHHIKEPGRPSPANSVPVGQASAAFR